MSGRLHERDAALKRAHATNQRRARARKLAIVRMWNEGSSARHIARELDTTAGSIRTELRRLRASGYDVPRWRDRIPPP